MQKIRKTLVVMLVIFGIVGGLTVNCFALEVGSVLSAEESKALNEALQIASVYADDVDYASLSIGGPIQTYEYMNQSFVESIVMYPLTVEGKLVLLAIKNGDRFQITDALVDEINNVIDSSSRFTIIYDNKHCYLYVNNHFVLLCEDDDVAENRDALDVNGVLYNYAFATTTLADLIRWEYEEVPSARVQKYYGVSVSYVPQVYNHICWAATVAMIVNCVKETDLTAVKVARAVYSWEKFDYGLDRDKIPAVFAMYGLSYTYKDQIPNDNMILRNIMNGYPIYASFNKIETNTGHAGVIYGVNVTAGYIQVMDPAFGSISATYDLNEGTYTYISAKNGVTHVLHSASAYDWS